ncbi:uncharacterized protein N7482_003524 [Penicillium canariense]|uniref:SH3 domain-containing protein n=1 Tax=Penicillium canariense TaxID=189055 RepID=A0A9W9I7C6_9EURO|nr:uncharacterized protein N7482_003524 [Penicillium canariense]KAJ5167930.1 hypothetical protein N7482_003524 [Penicillium canariense]
MHQYHGGQFHDGDLDDLAAACYQRLPVNTLITECPLCPKGVSRDLGSGETINHVAAHLLSLAQITIAGHMDGDGGQSEAAYPEGTSRGGLSPGASEGSIAKRLRAEFPEIQDDDAPGWGAEQAYNEYASQSLPEEIPDVDEDFCREAGRLVRETLHLSPSTLQQLVIYPCLSVGGDVSQTTVILPLHQGDIIFVHSIHTNGWADGTLLETGARGWLPTNYCDTYDQLPMRRLLDALSGFWDITHGGLESLGNFGNQDRVQAQGLIDGVRFLLAHDSLRRIRKALLADLSSLVQTTKKFHEIASGQPMDDEVEYLIDKMLLKAFQTVTRGVRFLDVWSAEVGLNRTITELEPPQIALNDIPLTSGSEASPMLFNPIYH